ncbi:MAG: hypothetical protein ACFHU9_03715 [Fluviicola sp.]
MTYYIHFFLSTISLALISCNANSALSESTSKSQENSVKVESIKAQVYPESDSIPTDILDLFKTFYDKVCYDLKYPRPTLDQNGYYALNINAYKNNLSATNLFTNSFINRQDEIFSECKNALERDSITPQKVPDGMDVSAPVECGFFHYNYYLNSQERPDGFFLRESKFDETNGLSEVHFYTLVEDSFFTWDNQTILQVDLIREKQKWKINNVKKLEK